MNVSRRSTVQAIGATVSLGAVPVLGEAQSTVRLPILKSTDGVVKEKRVSEAWNDHKLLARQVRTHVAEKFLPRDGIKQVGIVGGEGDIDGQQRLAVEVDLVDTTSTAVPRSIDGIPIQKREARESVKVCYNESKFTNTPGGVHFQIDDTGTSGAVVKDSSGTKYMLTAAHLGSDQCSNIDTEKAYQFGTEWGEVADHDSKDDWAVVEKTNSNFSFDPKIKLEGSTRIDVDGWVTQNGLETHVDTEDVKKMGTSTGVTKDKLNKISISGTDGYCTDWNGDGYEALCNVAKGDSGGPCWYEDDATLANYMIGIVNEGETDTLFDDCEGHNILNATQGYQAEAFVNSTNYEFDSP